STDRQGQGHCRCPSDGTPPKECGICAKALSPLAARNRTISIFAAAPHFLWQPIMGSWSRRIPFRVDIAGVIEIMGSSLYSRPDTPVRELIQNAHDAVVRRRKRDMTYQGRIDIEQD